MTDHLPSKECGDPELVAELRATSRALATGQLPYSADLVARAANEIQRLREDLRRTESAHAAVMAENTYYKQRAADLDQCHREGWRYAKEVEDEYERRTGHRFGAAQPPPVAPDWCPTCQQPYDRCRCNGGKGLPR